MTIFVVPECASTNAELLSKLAQGTLPEFQGLLAQRQTAGRGRLGRNWDTSQISALTFSFGFTPRLPREDWGWLPLLAGVAVHRGLAGCGVSVGVKWPNDVVIDADDGAAGLAAPPSAWQPWRKAGGILTEVAPSGQVVVGIGLNLQAGPQPADDAAMGDMAAGSTPELAPFPEGLPDHAGFIWPPAATAASPVTLAEEIIAQYIPLVADPAGARSAVTDVCVTLGQTVVVHTPSGQVRGTAESLAEDGALLVQTDTELVAISSGDVQSVRA